MCYIRLGMVLQEIIPRITISRYIFYQLREWYAIKHAKVPYSFRLPPVFKSRVTKRVVYIMDKAELLPFLNPEPWQ